MFQWLSRCNRAPLWCCIKGVTGEIPPGIQTAAKGWGTWTGRNYHPSQWTWKTHIYTNNYPNTVNMKVMRERDSDNENKTHIHIIGLVLRVLNTRYHAAHTFSEDERRLSDTIQTCGVSALPLESRGVKGLLWITLPFLLDCVYWQTSQTDGRFATLWQWTPLATPASICTAKTMTNKMKIKTKKYVCSSVSLTLWIPSYWINRSG